MSDHAAQAAQTAKKGLEELSASLLGADYHSLTPVQKSVLDLLAAERPSGLEPLLGPDKRTFWPRLADRLAEIGGSWAFLGGFGATLALWVGWNLVFRHTRLDFDPYPFVFLNLMLSMLAAVQAPVILMSQNRQAVRDRQEAEHDYRVNLRAELEIMHLHDKIDALRVRELQTIIADQQKLIATLAARP